MLGPDKGFVGLCLAVLYESICRHRAYIGQHILQHVIWDWPEWSHTAATCFIQVCVPEDRGRLSNISSPLFCCESPVTAAVARMRSKARLWLRFLTCLWKRHVRGRQALETLDVWVVGCLRSNARALNSMVADCMAGDRQALSHWQARRVDPVSPQCALGAAHPTDHIKSNAYSKRAHVPGCGQAVFDSGAKRFS